MSAAMTSQSVIKSAIRLVLVIVIGLFIVGYGLLLPMTGPKQTQEVSDFQVRFAALKTWFSAHAVVKGEGK